MAKRLPRKATGRRRRSPLKLIVALAAFGLLFGTAAAGVLWVADRMQLLPEASSPGAAREDLSSEERRALDRIIEQDASRHP
jgi:hypothetical protein